MPEDVVHLKDPMVTGCVPNQEKLHIFDLVYDSVRGKPFGKDVFAKND